MIQIPEHLARYLDNPWRYMFEQMTAAKDEAEREALMSGAMREEFTVMLVFNRGAATRAVLA